MVVSPGWGHQVFAFLPLLVPRPVHYSQDSLCFVDFALSAVPVKGWGEEGRPVPIPRSGGRLGEGDLKGVSGTLDSDPLA